MHYYLVTHAPEQQREALNRALAGPVQMPRSETAAKILPPPPRWNSIPAAAIERLAQLRAKQAAAAAAT